MIVTCPECKTRFIADESLIGSKGRTLKCGACAYVWFYTHDKLFSSEETGDFETNENSNNENSNKDISDISEADEFNDVDGSVGNDHSEEPIPEIIKPLREDKESRRWKSKKNISVSIIKRLSLISSFKERLAAAGVAFCIFFLLAAVFVYFPARMVSVWPKTIIFYKNLWASHDLFTTQDVVIENIRSEAAASGNEQNDIKISYNIINLASDRRFMPQINALLLDDQGNLINQVKGITKSTILKGEETVEYATTLQDVSLQLDKITLKFSEY